MAIPLAGTDDEAVGLVRLAILTSAWVSAVLMICALAWFTWLPMPTELKGLGAYFLAIPAAVFLAATFDTLTMWNLRRDLFHRIAIANVTKACAGAGVQISLGLAGLGLTGIITGNIASLLSGNTRLLGDLRERSRDRKEEQTAAILARKYSKFPKYDLPSNLANVLGVNLLVIGMTLLYPVSVVGQFALAFRLLTLPASVLGTSVAQVYLREASLRSSDRKASLAIFDTTLKRLIGTSVLPFLLIAVIAPDIFSFTFGSDWRNGGLMASAMMPLVWLKFISSPLTTTFLIHGRQRPYLYWQLAILALTAGTFLIAFLLDWGTVTLLTYYSCGMAVIYAMLILHARRIVAHPQVPQGENK